ncbi:cation:proton antiporter [Candidatus Woesearchaeota archaeon]|nr:cation:proton antiporter [Candidatus Woesearchaeota archaeon]
MDIIFEIGMLVIFAGLGTYLAKLTRQPLVPAYVISGIVVGKILGIVTNTELISQLSEFGIAFLLFMVGLEMEFKKLKDIGVVSVFVGLIQMAVTFLAGYFSTEFLGFTHTEAVYLGLVIAFSSTMVVIKILSDKLETNTLHGRLIIGILVMQDIVAIAALSYLASLSSGSAVSYIFFTKIVLVLALGIGVSNFVFPHVFEFAAKSRELLLTTSLSVCFLFAFLFSSIGLSLTVGAFVAGVLLANLPYNIEIVGRVRPLRDFFSILFFTSLGLQLVTDGLGSISVPLLVLLALVIIVKPVVIVLSLVLFGHQTRTSFIAGTSLAQVSEFSLILVMIGLKTGAVSQSVLTLTVMLAIATMAFTSYFMSYEDAFYKRFLMFMGSLGINVRQHTHGSEKKSSHDVILCGYDRIGYSILKSLRAGNKSVVVIDFNPDMIKKLNRMRVDCIYGDICDPEVFSRLDFRSAKTVISTANSYEDNLLMLQKVKAANRYVPTIVTAHKIDEALELYRKGADYVILPHFLGGDMVSSMLPDFESNQFKTLMLKYKHINDLVERKNVGHEHPTHEGAGI